MSVLMEQDCGLEDTMEATGTLGDQLYRDEVLAARLMTPEEKLLAGPQLFDFACRIALDGIRNQFPDVDEQRVRQILAERVELGRRLENTR
jgi:hypothetical protein